MNLKFSTFSRVTSFNIELPSSPENIMELTIIALTLTIVFAGDDGGAFEVKRHLAAVCVVLSWMEVLLLIGRHPR